MSEREKFEAWYYGDKGLAAEYSGLLDGTWKAWKAAKADSAAEIAALRTELEQARKDAERYRWLKANCATRPHLSIPIQLIAQESWSSRFNGYRQHLDAAIDVAKEQGK